MTTIFGHLPLSGSPPATNRTDAPPSGRVSLRAPMTGQEGAITLGIVGRPRVDNDVFDAATIGGKILALYRREGQQFLSRLRGTFALCVIDAQAGRTLLAIDRMGIESLAWGMTGTEVAFGTSAAEVAQTLFATPAVNPQALFDFMLGHMISAPDTAYAGVSKLPAASCVQIDHGRATLQRYWNPQFRRPSSTNVTTLRDSVLPTLLRAVAATAPEPRTQTGSFLSGGLDSSTVTGLLAQNSGRQAPAFSVGFGVEEFDELAYARMAVSRFHCPHYEYQVTADDIVDAVPRIAAAYDEPFGNSSAVPTYCCARLAKSHGIDHLLAGDGGDELFGGNERYVKQKVFEVYRRLPKLLRAHVLEPAAEALDPTTSPFLLRKFSSYVRQARVPLPERFESWNMIYREGSERVFDATFLGTVDPRYPLRKMRETWESCPSTDLLDRMLWYDWKYTLADNDLPKVTRMCELAGVRVSFPMLEADVVDLSLQVPSASKINGNELRSFFKASVRDFLPADIISKKKHGFGLPFGAWLKEHRPLQELVYDSLASLKRRHILDRDFIERVITEHREGHASYYGYAIWDLLMLEQWLASRAGLATATNPTAAARAAGARLGSA